MKKFPKGVVDRAYSSAWWSPARLGWCAFLFCCLFCHQAADLGLACLCGFFLNLFNLLPMSPLLMGRRIVGAVWRGFWIIGVVAAVALAFFLESPIILLFSVFGLNEINRRFMRVHWTVYALLGTLALITCAICDELIFGFDKVLPILLFTLSQCHGLQSA